MMHLRASLVLYCVRTAAAGNESKIAVLDLRLKEEQQDRTDAVKVSAAQAAVPPAGMPSYDHGLVTT